MSYTKQNFTEGQILNADHLNTIETGIETNDLAITALSEDMNARLEAALSVAESAVQTASELSARIDTMMIPFAQEGALISCQPIADYPLSVVTKISLMQGGSGDPAPANIRPISGWEGAKLKRTGRNLYDGGDKEIEDMKNVALPVPLPPGTYTVSAIVSSTDTDDDKSSLVFIGGAGDGQNLFVSFSRDSYQTLTVTLAAPCSKLRFYASNTYDNSTGDTAHWWDVQIIPGNRGEAFIPFQGDTFEVAFGQTVYDGKLDWKTGALTVTHRLLTLTGNESWGMNKSGVFHFGLDSAYKTPLEVTDAFTGACSHYKSGLSYNEVWNAAAPAVAVAHAGSISYVRIHDGNYTALADFKTFLAAQYAAGTPVQIAYPLAAETQIQLSPQQILSLEGENNLWSDCGDTEVRGALSPKVLEDRIAALEAIVFK